MASKKWQMALLASMAVLAASVSAQPMATPGPSPSDSAAPASQGNCSIDATPGIRYTGVVWYGWRPLLNYGTLAASTAVQRDIPTDMQGQSAPTYGDCNCMCNQVDTCVGYTWLGGDTKQCWLHSYVEFWWREDQLTTYYYASVNTNVQTPVPVDSVIARRVSNGTDWPLCSKLLQYASAFEVANSSNIRSQINGLSNHFECNQACGNDPSCVGMQWTTSSEQPDGNTTACVLYSETQGLKDGPNNGTLYTWSAPLQICMEDATDTWDSKFADTFSPSPPPAASSCGLDASPGIRYEGQVWQGWIASNDFAANDPYNLPIAWNVFIPPEQQGNKTSNYQECNCNCVASDQCIGYTWLGGDLQQCWLHSKISFHNPTAYFFWQPQNGSNDGSYMSVPPDSVTARVIRSEPNTTTATDPLTVFQGCQTVNFIESLIPAVANSKRIRYNPTKPIDGTQCNSYCMYDPHCVAYSWKGLNPDEIAQCILYSEVSGTLQPLQFNDTVFYYGWLQICAETLPVNPPGGITRVRLPPMPPTPVFQPPPPATPQHTCAIDYLPGVRYTGKVWPNWAPVKDNAGSGMSAGQYASNAFIPDDVQGLPALDAMECNCRCNNVSACIGYTWLGAQRKECWLHSYVQFYVDPVSTFYDPLSVSTTPTPVPADTILARLVPGNSRASSLASCGLDAVTDMQVSSSSTANITQSNSTTPTRCAELCLQDTNCVAITWSTSDGLDAVNSSTVACSLMSQATGGLIAAAPSSTGVHSYVAPLQSCKTLRLPAATAPAPPAPPAPPATATTCPASITPGIRYKGRVWPGWLPLYRGGWKVQDGTASSALTWSNNYIPDAMQATSTPTPEACNCQCTKVDACVGFTWLGGDKQQCWLHSWVQWFVDPVATYQDVPSGATVDVPADTVLARVIKDADWPLCSASGSYYAKQGIASASSQGITRPSPVGATWQECNQECGRDPACVAFSWQGASDPATNPGDWSINCQLYSQVSGGLTFNSSSNGITFTSPLQACAGSLQELAGQPPSQAAGSASGGAGGSGSSKKSSVSIGVIVGIAAGGGLAVLAIAGGIAALIVYRRKRRDRDSDHSWLAPGKSDRHSHTGYTDTSLGTPLMRFHAPMTVPGLAAGEIFTRATAYEYSWIDALPDASLAKAVEAGITDTELDTLCTTNGAGESAGLPPVVEFSKADLKKNVQLIKGGLLGRGATALVFQCVWPSRFGPNSVLAAKVLKDGHEVDPLVLQSFAYEASVLASTEHPCVVRLYGYCLEPPTVCLILELLPYSLRDLLYGSQAYPGSTGGRLTLPSGASHSLLLPTMGYETPSKTTHHSHTGSTTAAIVVVAEEHEHITNNSGKATIATTNMSNTSTPVIPPGDQHHQHAPSSPRSATHSSFLPSSETPRTTVASELGLSRPPPLNMLQVLRISTEIAAGLAYLHERTMFSGAAHVGHAVLTLQPHGDTMFQHGTKIVHRDLKPGNILVNSRGRAKISDFGLARRTQRTTVHTERLGAGTLPYMAPELLVGSATGTAYNLAPTNRVDIYSLAMMMWEMVSGKQPWSDKNEVAIMSAVIRNQRPELPNLPKGATADAPAQVDLEHLPASPVALPAFNDIIRACWNQREHKRPTATAVYSMLCNVLRRYGQVPPEDLHDTIPQPLQHVPTEETV